MNRKKKENYILSKIIYQMIGLPLVFVFFMFGPIIMKIIAVIALVWLSKKIKKINIKQHGNKGENIAYKKLSELDGTLFFDLEVKYDDVKAQIDFALLNKKGLFLIESKHHVGNISGDLRDRHLEYDKVSSGGNVYSKEIYNPLKQVNTHVFKLSNFLKKKNENLWIEGLVFLSHPKSAAFLKGRAGDLEKFCQNIEDLKLYIENYEPRHGYLNEDKIKKVSNILKRIETS